MYVPLRVHGHHSMLTGVDAPAALLERAETLGLPALALTDVGTLAGVVDFLRVAEASGKVRPIVGAELDDPAGPGRVIALVESETGWRNLCKLVSARRLGDDPGWAGARLEGPESFRLAESVARFQEGLVLLADHPRLIAALAGRVPAESLFVALSPAGLRRRGPSSALGSTRGSTRNAHRAPLAPEPRRAALALARGEDAERDAPAEDEFDESKVPPPARATAALELVLAARAHGLATLAVPDVHCALPAGLEDHRLRVAIKHNVLLEGLPEEWTAEAPAHLLAAREMAALYADLPEVHGPCPPVRGSAPGALARTLLVAERCAFTPPLGRTLLPTIELEEEESAWSRLWQLAFEGARRRYRPLRPEVVRRLEHELDTIDRSGYAPYFLLVLRIADFARERAIPCVGRGSAADSLVAYCLGLTDADPLRYELIFERFLNPARRDRPDIDLDFCWRRRDEVVEHVWELFGAERTAMISTLVRCGLRAAFRESALVLGLPPVEVERWSRRLPLHAPAGFFDGEAADESRPLPAALADNLLARAFQATPEAAGFPFDDERMARALKLAARLVGAPRHQGLHPGGVVVAPGSITDVVSCQRARKGVVVTQFDKDAVEALGLVKMDLLGNRALTVIADCRAALEREGVALELEDISEDDPRTAHALREGRTLGCFQVESPGMRNLLVQIGARTMDDVIQAIALIRPGPAGSGMKDAYVRRFRGLEDPAPPHPRLVDILWDARGVMLYQEDVMRVAARIAGMELAEADLLRRALQKRRGEDLARLRERFVAGGREQGLEPEEVLRVWELVANFASFGFCKAHAVTYGRIAYRTVWLKTHHPALYLAAFLASETGYYDPRVYVEEARRLGVPILGPDVNRSARSFAAERLADAPPHFGLRIGLGQVKGLSERTLERLSAERARAPFLSLPDFLERSGAAVDEAQSLILCGAFDAFDRTRPELLWRLHLLKTPTRRPPRRAGEEPLDPAQLAACRETPASRAASRTSGTGGWGRTGIGLGKLDLSRGECAALFPEPEAPALALPRLPDASPLERGRAEHERMGLTVELHPTRLFPCPADARRPPGARLPETIPCAELARYRGGRVTLRGWPAATRRVPTSDGRWMRFLTLEDESGLAEAVLFPDVYRRDGRRLAEFGTLCISGLVEEQMGACSLHAERVW